MRSPRLRTSLLSATLLALALPAMAQSGMAVNPRTILPLGSTQPAPDNTVYLQQGTNCAYMRSLAPGQRPTWHLIINPAIVGLPEPTGRCKIVIRS